MSSINYSQARLFEDEEFDIKYNKNKTSIKDIIKKIETVDESEIDADKLLKSKNISIEDRLFLIKEKVLKVLGKQRKNVIVIKTKKEFDDYIDAAIASGRIAIDTETNNSLDPVTCKLMGPCFYYPGGKQAYVPINHVDYRTEERLSWQLTESDVRDEIKKINNSNTFVVMHNGKFDYEVIKCTCGIIPNLDWDTIVAARLLNENEEAGLKPLYRKYIDPSQEKYDIDKLFTNIQYAYVDPEIFALYAATDSMMTDKIFLYQKPIMEAEVPHLDSHGREVKGIYWLFKNVEMPIVKVTAEMELRGVKVDTELGKRLKDKYESQLISIDNKISTILEKLAPTINEWKLSKEATCPSKQYEPKKTKKSQKEIEAAYPLFDSVEQKRYKEGKPKADQLSDNINLDSPVQLAILLYDILKCKQVSDKAPRGTGQDEMKAIAEYFAKLADNIKDDNLEDLDAEDLEELAESSVSESANDSNCELSKSIYESADELCTAILERRGITKLLTTYIDTIPTLVKHWPDGRIRFHLNSLGTDTGRYSSGGKLKFWENGENVVVSGINIQNIPSRSKNIRLLFQARTDNHVVECKDNYYEIPESDEVETIDGWKKVEELAIGDTIIGKDNKDTVKSIIKTEKSYLLYV